MSCFQMRWEQALYDIRFPDHAKQRANITDESGAKVSEIFRAADQQWFYLDMSASERSGWQGWKPTGETGLGSAAAAAARAYQRENDREAVMV